MKYQESKYLSQILCALCIGALLSACVKVEDPAEEKDAAPVAVQREYEVQALGPNQYQVWLPMVEGVQSIQRENIGTRTLQRVELEIQAGRMLDRNVEPGASYSYTLFNEDHQVLRTFQVSIPTDLVISGSISLTGDTQWSGYHRIFISRGAVVTTQGFRLSLQADELFSEGGTFQTLPSGVQASYAAHGRNGGSIEMQFQRAEGDMAFRMRGENGGAAMPGITGGAPGGAGGNSGFFVVRVSQESPLKVSGTVQAGAGGAGFYSEPSSAIGGGKIICEAGKNGQAEQSCFQNGRQINCQF